MEGVNAYEGTACKVCSAPLRVLEVGTPTDARTPEGQPINSSVYECAGPERHCFSTLSLRSPTGRWAADLVLRSCPPAPPTQS